MAARVNWFHQYILITNLKYPVICSTVCQQIVARFGTKPTYAHFGAKAYQMTILVPNLPMVEAEV